MNNNHICNGRMHSNPFNPRILTQNNSNGHVNEGLRATYEEEF